MANPEMNSRDSTDELLSRISKPGREFVRLISSSSLEQIQYSRSDILRLINRDKALIKETEKILSILVDFGVIPKIKDDRK